jgi:hypothetical protein
LLESLLWMSRMAGTEFGSYTRAINGERSELFYIHFR